ncbi:DGQHR domain-containing protein [Hydrogenophaga sp. RWCD_12]|uniref:DGQHR domain-containing protein n=1 Tax=Hydrogenophaga sp. RWCD_12 TaxID=3391190 RepID=UPI003984E3CF
MSTKFPCLPVQSSPEILSAVIPGSWLLTHCTPTWRKDQPVAGFQRVVDPERAQTIAVAVLDQQRTFPNAIVLATDIKSSRVHDGSVSLPDNSRFLIIDGQHRLYSQKFSEFDAPFICVIHFGLTEKEMAELFLEINDNQKRVPSSLRWDLFRLTRPDEDPIGVRTSDLVFDLASSKESALYQRIDLTGEQPGISLKQGSVAPAIKALISTAKAPLHGLGYEVQLKLILDFVAAMRECDTQGWDSAESPLYGARVFRAVLRLFGDIATDLGKDVAQMNAADFFQYLSKIDLSTLNAEAIKASQGSAGIKAIYDMLVEQVLA